jgi:hypothetical protein
MRKRAFVREIGSSDIKVFCSKKHANHSIHRLKLNTITIIEKKVIVAHLNQSGFNAVSYKINERRIYPINPHIPRLNYKAEVYLKSKQKWESTIDECEELNNYHGAILYVIRLDKRMGTNLHHYFTRSSQQQVRKRTKF